MKPGIAFEENLPVVELNGRGPSSLLLVLGYNRRHHTRLSRYPMRYLPTLLVGRPICEGREVDDLPTVLRHALLGKLLQFLPIITASHCLVPQINGIIGPIDAVPFEVLSQLSVAPRFKCADLNPTECVHGERPHEGILHAETSVDTGTLQAQEDPQVH